MSGLLNRAYNPDILNCLANLSSDEVFTPPDLANKMLDLLPAEIWESEETTILDPACKSGVFLREAAKRFIRAQIPDYEERSSLIEEKERNGHSIDGEDAEYLERLQSVLDHVFKKQLFGMAITELTSLLSRRSVYCSKYPESPYSVVHFNSPAGHISYKAQRHTWKGGKCVFCGVSEKNYKRASALESYAYEFIHLENPEEVFNMKFDVIIGNPPYQLSDGGAQASAKPIYQLFVKQAIKLNPRYLVMIIPARWYAGGKGLEQFRIEMLSDCHIEELHDFPITNDCFPGVNIRAGVCYFKWNRAFDNSNALVKMVTHIGTSITIFQRPLRLQDDVNILIRYSQAKPILEKVLPQSRKTISEYVSRLRPFGLRGYFTKDERFRLSSRGLANPIVCYGKGKQIGYMEKSEVPENYESIDCYKVFIPRANNIATELSDDNLNAFVGKPGEICTESFLMIGHTLNLSRSQAEKLAAYLRTRFARFMHSLAKSSQDATAKTWRFVPLPPQNIEWTDVALNDYYGLSKADQAFIECMIKPMETEI